MKRGVLLSAVALVASVAAYAQMMPDSTVQIVAYWSKGDKLAYDCTTTSYTADENDNRSDVSATSETRVFEVLDAREDGYTLRLSYKNVFSPTTVDYLTPEEYHALCENLTITFTTDEFGSVTGIVDSEECKALLSDMIDKMAEGKMKEMDKDTRKAFPKGQFLTNLKSMFCSDEFISLTAGADITPFFTYHGARLDTTQVYSFPQDYTLPMAGNQTFEVETELWVDEKLTDENSAVIRTDALATKDVLFPLVLASSVQLAKTALETAGEELSEDEIVATLTEELNKQILDITMEVYTTTEIHLASGWPIQWYSTRETVTVGDGKTTKKVIEQSACISDEE